MQPHYLQGAYFGIISGTITTLGLTIGLQAGTRSRLAMISGILAIAISDTLSDAFGLYVSKKAEHTDDKSDTPFRTAAAVTAAKFVVASSFLVPVLLVADMSIGVMLCVAWGFVIVASSSAYLAALRNENVVENVLKYLLVTMGIIGATHLSGGWIHSKLEG